MFKKTKVCTGVMVALGGAATLVAMPAAAQAVDRVEITGSAIRRVDAESALPVQVLKRDDIARTGVVNTEQLLQAIAAVSSQGSINNSTGAGNSTYGLSSVSLRGLGEDRTLVLVNGRRLAAFAGGNGASVNVNAIPLAAIERVEVLKDGASAIYGSDAIAGVVNFILTKNFQGVDLSATHNQPTRSGGGDSQKAAIVVGFGDLSTNRFNVTVSASFQKEAALFAKDRKFARTGNVPPFITAAATGQGNIEGAYNLNPNPGVAYDPAREDATQRYPVPAGSPPGTLGQIVAPPGNAPGRQVRTNPAFPSPPGTPVEDQESPNLVLFGNSPGAGYGNPLAASDQCAQIRMFRDPTLTSKGMPFCSYDSNADVGLVPKTESSSLSANLTFKIAENLEAFGDLLYSRNVVTQEFQPSPMRRSFSVTDSLFATQGVEPALVIRPTNPNYAIAANYLTANGFADLVGQPLAVTARVFDFGPRVSKDTSTQSRVTAGLKGLLGNHEWEVAASQNENKLSGTVPDGYFSQVKFTQVVNAPTSDYNPWSLTQSAAFNAALAASGAKYTGATLDAKSKSTSLDGRLAGDLTQLPAGVLQYALGLQRREESLQTVPSEALGTGDIAGLGGATPPVDKDRTITSVVGELNVPVLKGLEGNVALRRDKYSDSGSSTTYKASMRYQPVREVVLRASVGSGFRAPTLIDLWQPQTLGSSEQFNDTGTGGTGQTDLQVNALTGGNPDLKPEKSKQASLGVVFQPTQQLSFGVDYFQFKVTNIIAQPSAQEVVSKFRAGDPAFAGLVTLTGNDIERITQTLQNVGEAEVQGLDLEASFRQNIGGGRLDINLSGTYMLKFDQTSPGGAVSRKVATIVEPNGDPVLSTNTSVNDGVVLRWKHYLSGTWTQGPYAITLAQNYYSGYRDGNDLNGNEHRIEGQAIYDAQFSFTGIKNLRLALGVKNLFDKSPPIFIPTSNQFQGGYDITQYDPRARQVYLTAGYKF